MLTYLGSSVLSTENDINMHLAKVWTAIDLTYEHYMYNTFDMGALLLHSRIIHIQPYTHLHAETKSTIMTNEHTSLEKYMPPTLYSKWLRKGYERVMCERWVGDWTNWNILTPTSFVFSSTSSSFCWAAQSGVLRAHSPLLGAGSLYSILSPTNWTCLWHRVI